MEPLEYIDREWELLTRYEPKDKGTRIGMPHPYIVPSDGKFDEMYYWDSYFTILGLLESDRFALAKGMVDNCIFLIRKYGFVPNGNRTYFLTRSQPPFFTAMVRKIYEHKQNKTWLRKAFVAAKKEYAYWTDDAHITAIGLSRYQDRSGTHEDVENESGWDLTSRFDKEGCDYVPVCLNALLYAMEKDMAFFSKELGQDPKDWLHAARKRKQIMMKYFSHNRFFYDYNMAEGKHSRVKSLAPYYLLWAGVVSKEQAARLVRQLKWFEHKGGLSTCDKDYGYKGRQWNYPNGWAPLHTLVVDGLVKYGFRKDAVRIMKKWNSLCEQVYRKTGTFWEKYDVVRCVKGKEDARYAIQEGFAWTNAGYVVFKNALQDRT